MIYLYIILLAGLSAYREIQILIDRGSWSSQITWLYFWHTEWNSYLKLFDSFHFMGGLFTLVFCVVLVTHNKKYPWYAIVYLWALFYYIRNIFMHIIFMNPEFMRFEFLIPIIQ